MKPLAGKRVVDFSRYAPGPYASLVCAALGADVIKIEAPPDGDPMRAVDAEGFRRLNRGKKSVAVDLKSASGVKDVRRLLSTANVVIESFRPGVVKRLGVDYASVRHDAPALVYVSISGYGREGPLADRAGHDVNYMASAGALEGLPRPLPLQVADFAGGLYAVVAILSALLEGKGRFIDLSLHEGVLALSPLADTDAGAMLSGDYPNYGVYPTSDGGAIAVGALEPKFWQAFCDGVGRPDWVSRRDEPELRDEVAALIATRTRDDWARVFAASDACVETVRAASEAFDHPQALFRGATATDFRLPFGLERVELGDAPALGAHTRELLG